eukprot:Gregarina_sp_Pseudo_9__5615@NODE_772_length_2234_cov_57_841002_g727_i0_p1_GENE_NODE_772_length_2234_cov_57_841002_g727_i0NODE_772_length_2234_cov_57_841002_g727_i0_p1_ORF_typecomplete_len328_score28_72_NODE_772_length_2234_cov_57_841002_g727_i010832066
MKVLSVYLTVTTIGCWSQQLDGLDTLLDSLLLPTMFDSFDSFDSVVHRVMDVAPHNSPLRSEESREPGEVMKANAQMNEQPFAGWLGPRFPLMSPFSDLMGLSSFFDAGGFLDNLLGDLRNFEVPNVTLSDAECLITVDLKDLDVNHTSFKVYGSNAGGISVEISTVKESHNATPEEGTKPERESTRSELGLATDDSLFRLRGASSISSFTTVRSFPTPQGCDITPDSSKATINAQTNQLLIKLPKATTGNSTEAEEAGNAQVVHAAQALSEVPHDDGDVIVRSALSVEQPQTHKSSSWFSRLFGSDLHSGGPAAKIQVPLVKYDEF